MTYSARSIIQDDETERRRLVMLQVCDSVFPIGAFALSNGMETFVQKDFLRNGKDFREYLKNYLEVAPYRELGQMMIAGQIAQDGSLTVRDAERKIIELDELATVLQSAREIREGSERMCARFMKLVDTINNDTSMAEQQGHRSLHACDCKEQVHVSLDDESLGDAFARYRSLVASSSCRGVHAIAMGLFAARQSPSLREAAVMYGYSLISALTMCAAKAVPLSQYSGQRALHDSFGDLVHAVDIACTLTIDDLGISGAYLDVAAMQHETLYSRLYMS